MTKDQIKSVKGTIKTRKMRSEGNVESFVWLLVLLQICGHSSYGSKYNVKMPDSIWNWISFIREK